MNAGASLVASAGVFLLLLAFFLNLVGRLSEKNLVYLGLNFLGAGLAGYASWRIGFYPFVVLEGTWCLVAALALVKHVVPLDFHRP